MVHGSNRQARLVSCVTRLLESPLYATTMSASHCSLRVWLFHAGLDPLTDVTSSSSKNSDIGQLMDLDLPALPNWNDWNDLQSYADAALPNDYHVSSSLQTSGCGQATALPPDTASNHQQVLCYVFQMLLHAVDDMSVKQW